MTSLDPDTTPLLQPRPRRPWILSSNSSDSPTLPASNPQDDSSHLRPDEPPTPGEFTRNKSILNLTASTLFGIYGASTEGTSHKEGPSSPTTPWGVGAITPRFPSQSALEMARRPQGPISLSDREGLAELEARLLRSSGGGFRDGKSEQQGGQAQKRRVKGRTAGVRESPLHSAVRLLILFLSGVAYGALAGHLHDRRIFTKSDLPRRSRAVWPFILWGLTGAILGSVLPWIDAQLGDSDKGAEKSGGRPNGGSKGNGVAGFPARWNGVIRSVGAFVGIAFAIRKLPWTSTLQLSLTLTLVNPFLWYLLDRTATGFSLSAATGVVGTLLLAVVQPFVETPLLGLLDPNMAAGTSNQSSAAAAAMASGSPLTERLLPKSVEDPLVVITWTASVLFCSSICFGSIGRLLTPGRNT